jgi:hypothetical protein
MVLRDPKRICRAGWRREVPCLSWGLSPRASSGPSYIYLLMSVMGKVRWSPHSSPPEVWKIFFREQSRITGTPSEEEVQRMYRAHGMERLVPPLAL